jgi:hypothetical protein
MQTCGIADRRPVASSKPSSSSSSSSTSSKPNTQISICELLEEVNETEKNVERDEEGATALKSLSHTKKHNKQGHFLEKSFIEGLNAVGECSLQELIVFIYFVMISI